MTPTVTERKNHPGTYKIVVDLITFNHLMGVLGAQPSGDKDVNYRLYVALCEAV